MDWRAAAGTAGRAVVAILCLWLGACAAQTPAARIQRDPAAFQALSSRHQGLVQQGRIERGMSREAVYLAWGPPHRVSRWLRNDVPLERWTWLGHQPVYQQRLGLGAGWGYHPRYGHHHDPFWDGGIDVTYIPFPAARADFREGRVSDWESRLR